MSGGYECKILAVWDVKLVEVIVTPGRDCAVKCQRDTVRMTGVYLSEEFALGDSNLPQVVIAGCDDGTGRRAGLKPAPTPSGAPYPSVSLISSCNSSEA